MTRTPRSLRSHLLPLALTATGAKRRMSSAEGTRVDLAALALRPEPHSPPRGLERRVDLSIRSVGGWPVYTVSPRTPGARERRVLYLHGGTWVHEIVSFHWRLIAELALAADAVVEVPIYPLAPLGTAGSVVPAVADLAAALVAEVGADRVTLIGDSAGGTIALAAAMVLRDRGTPGPDEIVLIAAPIDLRFTDPMIARIAPTDPWLAIPGIRVAVELWRGDLPLESPLVSPVFAPLVGIGRITQFTGTHDIAHADAITLRDKARREGHAHRWHVEPNLLHVYPLLPTPEGARARAEIARIVARDARMGA